MMSITRSRLYRAPTSSVVFPGRTVLDPLGSSVRPGALAARATSMIRNGLYLYESKALDGGYRGVVVLRDGSILGGGSFFYFIGTYRCSGGTGEGGGAA